MKKTVNYYNNFDYSIPHKSKLEEYCNVTLKNKKSCNFTISLDYIMQLIS